MLEMDNARFSMIYRAELCMYTRPRINSTPVDREKWQPVWVYSALTKDTHFVSFRSVLDRVRQSLPSHYHGSQSSKFIKFQFVTNFHFRGPQIIKADQLRVTDSEGDVLHSGVISNVWALSVVYCSKRTQSFGNWICYRPQVKWLRGAYSVVL
jgi:hypothetical protein